MRKYPDITEQELIQQCKNGGLKHKEMLYKRFYGYAMGVGLRYLSNRDDAMEAVNDAFIKVFNGIGSYNETLAFKPWLRKIIVNSAIDSRRKILKNLAKADLQEAEMVITPALALAQLQAADILKMMDTLPEVHRLVFNLYEMDGYKHEEISLMLGIPASSSRVYLTRAKEQLRKNILQQEEQ